MNNIDKRAVEVISTAINDAIKSCLRTISFDKTMQGRITAIISENRYKVEIFGSAYTAVCKNGQVFHVNDSVLVLFPQNNGNLKYIISGA